MRILFLNIQVFFSETEVTISDFSEQRFFQSLHDWRVYLGFAFT